MHLHFRGRRAGQFALIWALMSTAAQGSAQELTLERITALPSLTGTASSRPVWSPDGSRLAFLWNDSGMPFRDVWVVSRSGGAPARVTDLSDAGPTGTAASAPEPDPLSPLVRAFMERSRGGVSDVTWSPDGRDLIFSFGGHLYRVGADGSNLETLTREQKQRSAVAFSPDGRFLSWLQDGDLWLWNQETNESVQATRIGKPAIGRVPGARYATLDVELSSYEWSPDGAYVAAHLDDRSNVHREPIPNYLGEETNVEFLRRDAPGQNDHVRAMVIYAVAEGRLTRVALEDATDRRITAYGWSAPPSRLFVDQISENAVDRWIWVVEPRNGSFEQVWHDRRETRNSQRLTNAVWRSDGQTLLLTSDISGRHHLHAVSVEDGRREQLTRGDWSVASPGFGGASLAVSPAGEVFFVSTQKSPYERHVYRMAQTGGPVTQVTSLEGVHEPLLSPDGKTLALLHSNDVTPTELYLLDADGSSPERRVTHSPPEEFGDYGWVSPRYVTFPSRADGATLHGRLLEPPGIDRTKKYPAIIGPVYSNTVRNQWRGISGTFQQYQALAGYIVLLVDIRGSSGYGRKFREDLLYDYGGIDVEDLASGAAYLKSLPYVDPERVGIWGWSYGGLLTSMSLFKKPGVYRAGVAGAPATNLWHALTTQVDNAGRPDVNPHVYRKSSAISYGEDLHDALMIIHGLQDSVVLFRDSVILAEKLMLLGKDFDFVILPSATHSYGQKDYVAGFVLKKIAQHFERHLRSSEDEAARSQTAGR